MYPKFSEVIHEPDFEIGILSFSQVEALLDILVRSSMTSMKNRDAQATSIFLSNRIRTQTAELKTQQLTGQPNSQFPKTSPVDRVARNPGPGFSSDAVQSFGRAGRGA